MTSELEQRIEALYVELDHIEAAEWIITKTVKCCADALGAAAAREPDKQQQRRTTLSDMAHRLRLATMRHAL